MSKWSTEQDDILRRFGNHGAEECARIIKREFGVKRTPEAVRRHAYRIGASIVEVHICNGCGRKARKLDKEALCPACHQRKLAEDYKMRNRVLLREISSDEDEQLVAAKRDYAKQRQQVSRLRRKFGVS